MHQLFHHFLSCIKRLFPNSLTITKEDSTMRYLLSVLALFLVNLALAFEANGEETPRLKACPCNRMYAPVCATNGKVYGNSCTWRCAKKFHPSK